MHWLLSKTLCSFRVGGQAHKRLAALCGAAETVEPAKVYTPARVAATSNFSGPRIKLRAKRFTTFSFVRSRTCPGARKSVDHTERVAFRMKNAHGDERWILLEQHRHGMFLILCFPDLNSNIHFRARTEAVGVATIDRWLSEAEFRRKRERMALSPIRIWFTGTLNNKSKFCIGVTCHLN